MAKYEPISNRTIATLISCGWRIVGKYAATRTYTVRDGRHIKAVIDTAGSYRVYWLLPRIEDIAQGSEDWPDATARICQAAMEANNRAWEARDAA